MREETQGNDIECNIESNFDLDTFNDVEMKKGEITTKFNWSVSE